MIPQTLGSLVGFLFLVAPGIVFETVRERQRPSLEQSALREVSRIALASLVFSLGALLLLAIVSAAAPGIIPDPGQWLRQGGKYVSANYKLIGTFLLLELGLATGLAASAASLLGRNGPAGMRPFSAWYMVFRVHRPPRSSVFVRVLLDDGREYQGTLVGYTADYKLADRELQLGLPLYQRSPGGAKFTELPTKWKRLIIPGDGIRAIRVSYFRRPTRTEPP